jgi:hypothetical protein
MARPEGLEPPTLCLEGRRSVDRLMQLMVLRKMATPVRLELTTSSLEGWRSDPTELRGRSVYCISVERAGWDRYAGNRRGRARSNEDAAVHVARVDQSASPVSQADDAHLRSVSGFKQFLRPVPSSAELGQSSF